jgi:hypothetical protein
MSAEQVRETLHQYVEVLLARGDYGRSRHPPGPAHRDPPRLVSRTALPDAMTERGTDYASSMTATGARVVRL